MIGRGVRLAAVTSLALAVAGCGVLVLDDPDSVATSVSSALTPTGMRWTVSPWPLDDAAAVLCSEAPPAFSWDTATVPDTCARLETAHGPDGLIVEFDASAAPAGFAALLERSGPPWSLVVAGRKGLTSFSVITEVVDSPIPSDAGPS